MRRVLAILLLAPLTGCGAHLHRPYEQQLAQAAASTLDGLDWEEAFARDRAQRDALADQEAELGRAYADARREGELLDILTEPIGERSWAKLEERFVELAACMLDEPGTGGGRACRGRIGEAQREAARALLFDACPPEGCAWVNAIAELRAASSGLANALAAYDRARGLAGLGDAVATPAQCPVPIRLPALLRAHGQTLERACAAYEAALELVAEALPEASQLRTAIDEYRTLAQARDDYRQELRLLAAELGSLRFDGADPQRQLEQQIARYRELQAKYAPLLASAKRGDFGDLALAGTVLITRAHRAAIVRTLALLGAALDELGGEEVEGDLHPLRGEDFRAASGPAPAGPRDPAVPPSAPEPEPEAAPRVQAPASPAQPDPSPPRRAPPRRAEADFDVEVIRSLGATLVPVFGESWRVFEEQRHSYEQGRLLLSAEIERIQIDAMSRRLALTEERMWLQLALIETQLLALLRLRAGLEADWIPAARPSTPERDEFERLELELELAEVAFELAQDQHDQALGKVASRSGRGSAGEREQVGDSKQQLRAARAALDRASDAYHRQLAEHGAKLCVRHGSVAQTYERERACVGPLERLVGVHAELVGVVLPRMEALDRDAVRRRDEAVLLRDQAGLEIRVTYVAAALVALERFTAGGLEPREVAAIVGTVVGIGLGAAITAGVYIP